MRERKTDFIARFRKADPSASSQDVLKLLEFTAAMGQIKIDGEYIETTPIYDEMMALAKDNKPIPDSLLRKSVNEYGEGHIALAEKFKNL